MQSCGGKFSEMLVDYNQIAIFLDLAKRMPEQIKSDAEVDLRKYVVVTRTLVERINGNSDYGPDEINSIDSVELSNLSKQLFKQIYLRYGQYCN